MDKEYTLLKDIGGIVSFICVHLSFLHGKTTAVTFKFGVWIFFYQQVGSFIDVMMYMYVYMDMGVWVGVLEGGLTDGLIDGWKEKIWLDMIWNKDSASSLKVTIKFLNAMYQVYCRNIV